MSDAGVWAVAGVVDGEGWVVVVAAAREGCGESRHKRAEQPLNQAWWRDEQLGQRAGR